MTAPAQLQRRGRGNGFSLDNYLSGDEQVYALTFDGMSFINNIHRNLSFALNTTLRQLDGQSLFVNRLKQSRPEDAMNLDGRPNDLLGQFIVLMHSPCPR